MDRADLGNEPRSCCWTIPAPTHQRHTRGDIEVTTQVSPSHLPSKSFSRLLTNIWDVLRENNTRARLCPSLLCSPHVLRGA